MRIDLSCPVENRGTIVKTNPETNEQYLLLKLLNISEKTIASVEFDVEVYNAGGSLVATLPVVFEELEAPSKNFFAENKAISLNDVSDAKNFVVKFLKVVFDDEEIYEPSDENTVVVSNSDASVDEVIALREFVPDAVCFSQETDTYWKCVCGRPNFVDSENCVRCGRDKEEMISKFSSSEALENTIAEKIAQDEARAAEEQRLAEEALAAKKAKIKKIIISASIVVASIAVLVGLFFAGRFVYYNIAGNNALKNENYEQAYEFLSKTGSKKLSQIAPYVRGNTNGNLLAGGLSADDKENLYYLAYDKETYMQNLIKQNKSTRKTEILTDAAAGGLCVLGDYVYYIDTDYNVSRVTKDGKKIEKVLEREVTYINLIGNSLYYIQMDYDNPQNLTPEQCQALASQGQMKTLYRLHKYDINTKKDVVVCEDGLITCFIGDDTIYYVTDGTDVWDSNHLMSISLNGKNPKKLVDTPVYNVIEKDGYLYYTEVYDPEMKGQEINSSAQFSYKTIKMNLKDGSKEEILPEYMVISINESNGKLYLVYVNRDEYASYVNGETDVEPSYTLASYDIETKETKILLTGDIYTFNVSDEDIFCILSSSGVCRMKTDGSGFDVVYSDGTSTPPETEETEEVEE